MPHSTSGSSLQCFCGRHYSSPIDLEEHRIARGHFPSHRCKPSCSHPPAKSQGGKTRTCADCGKICERPDIFQDHRIATGHCYCLECGCAFSSPAALKIHRDTVQHASEFKCCDCDMSFINVRALFLHLNRPEHRKPIKKTKKKAAEQDQNITTSGEDKKCVKCARSFQSSKALQSHMNSLKHKPLSNLSCPVGQGCRGKFTSPSALLLHLESGRCTSGMDRDDILEMVQACDSDGMIHDRKLILTPSTSSAYSPVYTPSLTSLGSDWSHMTESQWSLLGPTPSIQQSTADHSDQWSLFEGSQISMDESLSVQAARIPTIRCPLCPKTRKPFKSALAFEQHMSSPVHSAKLLHCPSDLLLQLFGEKAGHKNKEKKFATLSGLVQHLEMGACKGGKRGFLHCVGLIQGHLEKFGFGGMRVLL